MYNQFTDRFKFVEVEVIKTIPFLGSSISAKENYSLVLYRNKEYVNLLRPFEKKAGAKPPTMRASDGDAVYKIDMRPRAVPYVGSFKTKDNYVQVYDFTLVLKVIDPQIFANRYSNSLDPIFVAMKTIRKALKKFGKEHDHDQLTKLKQPDLDWNKGLVEEIGVEIHAITKWILHEDKKRLETAEIEQDTEKEKLMVQRKAQTQLLLVQAERERASLQHMYQLYQQLSTTAANELKAILQERIRDAFESGEPIDKVAEQTLNLLNTLYKGIEKFNFSNSTKNSSNGASMHENEMPPSSNDQQPATNASNGDQPESNATNGDQQPASDAANGDQPATNTTNGDHPATHAANGDQTEIDTEKITPLDELMRKSFDSQA